MFILKTTISYSLSLSSMVGTMDWPHDARMRSRSIVWFCFDFFHQTKGMLHAHVPCATSRSRMEEEKKMIVQRNAWLIPVSTHSMHSVHKC